MKNINPKMKPRPLGNKQKAREKGFDWFKEVVAGYVKAGKMIQPTDKQLAWMFEETTGEKLKEISKPVKSNIKIKENG